jgi:sugar phosphate isomerase/epimerase
MTTIGIFAKTFPGGSPAANADAVGAHGFACVHYNLACAGLDPLPERLEPAAVREIRDTLDHRGIAMASIGGSFNMIHPNRRVREAGLRALAELAAHASVLGTDVITVCTGTRDPHDMWRRHRDNGSAGAWRDLCETMGRALEIAEAEGVRLGVETEPDNVVSSVRRTRRLLDEMRSPNLGVVFDPVNFFGPGDEARLRDVVDEGFDLLGEHVILSHAKDVRFEGRAVVHCAAGAGVLDYPHYLAGLSRLPEMPLIVHGVEPAEVPAVVAFLDGQR